MQKLSVAIITYNEEEQIAGCIESVLSVADEVVIVDSFSTDRTKEICESYGAKFIENPFSGHIQQKNFAITQTNYPFVLSLDADERLDSTLQNEILKEKKQFSHNAYSFNRLNFLMGKPIRGAGWYPDRKVRLFNKSLARWGGTNPHDKIEVEKGNAIKRLKGELIHHTKDSLSDFVEQMNKFTTISSKELVKRGYGTPKILFKMLVNPLFTFTKRYFFQKGWKFGHLGFFIAVMSGVYTFLKYFKLYALTKEKR